MHYGLRYLVSIFPNYPSIDPVAVLRAAVHLPYDGAQTRTRRKHVYTHDKLKLDLGTVTALGRGHVVVQEFSRLKSN